MKNWVQQAREASGLSLEDCASALFLSRDAFAQKGRQSRNYHPERTQGIAQRFQRRRS